MDKAVVQRLFNCTNVGAPLVALKGAVKAAVTGAKGSFYTSKALVSSGL
jgi:hypothetical protein